MTELELSYNKAQQLDPEGLYVWRLITQAGSHLMRVSQVHPSLKADCDAALKMLKPLEENFLSKHPLIDEHNKLCDKVIKAKS